MLHQQILHHCLRKHPITPIPPFPLIEMWPRSCHPSQPHMVAWRHGPQWESLPRAIFLVISHRIILMVLLKTKKMKVHWRTLVQMKRMTMVLTKIQIQPFEDWLIPAYFIMQATHHCKAGLMEMSQHLCFLRYQPSTIRGLVDPNIFHYAGHPPLQGWSHGNEPAPLLSTLPAIQTSTQPHTLYGFPPFPHSHHEGGAGPHVQPPPPAQAASPQHISQFSVTAGASSQLPPTAGISADELNCRLTTQTFVVSYITNCTKL